MKIPELADLVCALDQLKDKYPSQVLTNPCISRDIGNLEGKIEVLKKLEPEIRKLLKENAEMRVYLEQYRDGECPCHDEFQDENTKCYICPNVDKILENTR